MITDKQIDNVVNKYTKALGDTWSNSTPHYEKGIPKKSCLEFAREVLALRPVEDTLPLMELIVTKADVILCEYCYAESKDEQDPTTHYFSTIKYGECSCCHYKIKKEVNETEQLNKVW